MMPADTNRLMLSRVAQALGDLRDDLVFVGGSVTGLLLTTVRSQSIRPTDDVDMVMQATTALEYHEMEKQLQARGFAHDVSADAPICRWRLQEIIVDLMPSGKGVLSFHNRWYPLAVDTSQPVQLDAEMSIRLIAAPVFVATKFEAFHGRGKRDFLMSHDLEDIITVVDGRDELADEALSLSGELREYLGDRFSSLLATSDFLDALSGHLPGDMASQARLPGLIEKLRNLAQLESG